MAYKKRNRKTYNKHNKRINKYGKPYQNKPLESYEETVNGKRREPSGGFESNTSINNAETDHSIIKRRTITNTQLQAKLECLNLIARLVEDECNIHELNINKIKKRLTSDIISQNQKNEMLNEYYFVTQKSEGVQNEENRYISLSAICAYNCQNTRNQNDVYLWIQLATIFIENGMNPFIQQDSIVYLNKCFVDQYIHKNTLNLKPVSENSERSNLNYLASYGYYSTIIGAISKYLNDIPPIISVTVPHGTVRLIPSSILFGSVIGQSFRQFTHCEINNFALSPNSLKLSIRNLPSLVVDINDINKFDEAIVTQYNKKIKSIQIKDHDQHNLGCYNYSNESILIHLLLITFFYTNYQNDLLFQLKNAKTTLPSDVINIIINEYYFQNIQFLYEIKHFNEWFCIFFLNVTVISEKWQTWLFDNYLPEINKMINGSNINLFTEYIASHMILTSQNCEVEEMAIWVLRLYKKCEIDPESISDVDHLINILMYIVGGSETLRGSGFHSLRGVENNIYMTAVENRLKIIAKIRGNRDVIFKALLSISLRFSLYWVSIILIQNNLIAIENCPINSQIIEYEMNLEEVDEFASYHEAKSYGERKRIDNRIKAQNASRRFLLYLLREHNK